MALQSGVDCCNSALQRVGASSILSLTDNSREARACNQAYDSNRRSELRKHRWNFAIKRVSLAPDIQVPAFDFLYQFSIPSDCLRILPPGDITTDWVREGNKILTNTNMSQVASSGIVLNLRYITDVTDASQWDTAFYDMLALAIAVDIVEPLTNSTAKKSVLEKDYADALSEARRNNAFEQGPENPPDDDLWLVRF